MADSWTWEPDRAVHDVCKKVLKPKIIERALDLALDQLANDRGAMPQRAALATRLQKVEGELVNLSETAARGGAVPAVLALLASRDQERRQLASELAALDGRSGTGRLDRPAVKRQLRALLGDWSALLTENVADGSPLALRRPGGRQNRFCAGV